MAHIHDTILVKAPVDKVFAIGRDPRRWGNWWVNQAKPRRVRGHGSVGTVLNCRHLVAGQDLPLKMKVLVDRFDNDGSGHWWAALGGRLNGRQHWDYLPCEGGTQVIADIDLVPAKRVTNDTTDSANIERMEREAIHQTLENLKFMFEQ